MCKLTVLVRITVYLVRMDNVYEHVSMLLIIKKVNYKRCKFGVSNMS